MTTLKDKLKRLPAARRKKIDQRTAALVAEEMSTRELRKARNCTRAELAKTLHIKQEQVSRIEKRTDLHIATLRRQVEALGGDLIVIATFLIARRSRLLASRNWKFSSGRFGYWMEGGDCGVER